MLYRGKNIVGSGIAGFDGKEVRGVEYVTREKFMTIDPNPAYFYYVTEQIPREIIGAVAAGAVAGNTKFTVQQKPLLCNTFKVDLTEGVEFPNTGDKPPATATAYNSGDDIAAQAGDALVVYGLDADGNIVGFFYAGLTAGDIKA